MRTLILNLLATAVLFTVASQAQALSVTQTGTGGIHAVGDQVTLNYYLNNIGTPGIAVLAFSVTYDKSIVFPNLTLSNTQNNILKGSDDEAGNVPSNNFGGLPRLSVAPTQQDFFNQVLFSWSAAPQASWSEVSNQLVGTLVLDAVAEGVTNITPFSGIGSTVAQDAGSYANQGVSFADISNSMAYAGAGSVTIVPEPTTALLIGLGLAGLGAVRHGRRER